MISTSYQYSSVFIAISLSSMVLLSSCAVIAPLSLATTSMVVTDERSMGSIIDDKTIANRIRYELAKLDWYKGFSAINVSVFEGRVLLTGSTTKDDYLKEAVRLAWSTRGVNEVINEVNLKNKSLGSTAKDIFLINEIRAKLLLEKNLL